MLLLNEMSFTGEVKGIQPDENGGVTIIIQQTVANVYETAVAVFIIPALRDDFERKGIYVGDTISVVGGQAYQKDDIIRIRVLRPEQLPVKIILNSILISGRIDAVKEMGPALLLDIEQVVGGVIPTTFQVFVPESQKKRILAKNNDTFPFGVNDVVVIKGIMYSKEGIIRIRLSDASDIQKAEESFYLGEEEAKEKFI